MRDVRMVRIGDVAALVRRPIEIDPTTEYREIGIRSFGRGVFHKAPVSGVALGSKRVFWVEPGDLLLNVVFAWEGAVAVAGASEAGRCGSHRFLTYVVNHELADTSYLAWFLKSREGLALLGQLSPGSAGRNRTLSATAFESARVPLPSLERQRQVARLLNEVATKISRLRHLVDRAELVGTRVHESTREQVLQSAITGGGCHARLGDLATINPVTDASSELPPDGTVAFVPMRAVDDVRGTVHWPEFRVVSEISSGLKRFAPDDVLFARITPCMQNGKCAVVPRTLGPVAYGSTEFHVLRMSSWISPDWVQLVLRSRWFRTIAAAHFAGTAGQQRVPARFLENVTIPIPKCLDEQRRLIAEWRARESRLFELRVLHEDRELRSRVLLASAINGVLAT